MIILLALLLAFLPVEAPPRPLAVVFVTVAGGPAWTVAQQDAALADTAAALAWVRARGLDAPDAVEVLPSLAIDRADTWEWLRNSPRRLTLHLVANQGAPWLAVGPHGWGGAYVPPDRVVALAETPHGLPALIAHELTHALTGLPDWPEPCGVDILCSPAEAYAAGTLGCITLEALGRLCGRVYLPEVSL